MSDIIKFYNGEEVDGYPYKLCDIWYFSDLEIERIHNYIQWLFPTCDPRNKETGKPFLEQEDIEQFKNNKKLLENLNRSFEIIIDFYGFMWVDDKLVKKYNFDEKKLKNWLTKRNHNYLRLTRIISCLKTLGLEKEAKALFDILMEIYKEYHNKIGETTLNFWQKAIDGTLYDDYNKCENNKEIKDLKDKLKNIKWSI